MSFRTRLAVLFGFVALVASVLVGTFSYRTTTRELTESIDSFLTTRISEVSVAFAEAQEAGQRNGSGEGRSRPGRNGQSRFFEGQPVADDDSLIQVTTATQTVRSSNVELPVPAGVDDLDGLSERRYVIEDVDLEDGPYRMVSRAYPGGIVIQVARSTAEAEAVGAALLSRFALIAAFVAAAAAAVGWFIASRTTAPLRRLTAVASTVAATRDVGDDLGVSDADAARDDEIGKLASGFRSMLQRLDASREQQHRLIHDAGHELRTPLTSLRMNVAMLERSDNLPTEQREEVLGAIRSELVELGDLFDEMIDLATDQRGVDFRPAPVDLDVVVRSVVAKWARRSDRHIDVTSTSAIVDGDPDMLARAINNLVNNANKFSPASAPIEVVAADGAVSVRDAGPGIPPEERALVFERFHRSETTRSMPGSGLGLSIVAEIVDVHGGEVWATASPAGGAEVGFRIPTL